MRLPLAAALASLAVACTSPGAYSSAPSLDGEWREATRALNPPTITFEGNRASGFAGCNRWFAQVTRDGDALSFGGVGATRMMCDAAPMEIERRFVEALANTEMARLDGDTLVLSDIAGAELARFQRVR